jgi:nucleoid-associated protein YgaU
MPRMGRTICASTLRSLQAGSTQIIILLALLICNALACGPGKPQQTTTQQAQSPDEADDGDKFIDAGQSPGRIHIVQADETLYSLAQKYYGSGQQYTRIYYANRNRLRDPKNLTVGMKLIIP